MDMTPLNAIALGALAAGLVAIFVLIPVARLLPKRLQDRWLADAEVAIKSQQSGAVVEYPYTTIQRALIIIGAALAGALVSWKYGAGLHGIAHAFYFLCLVLLVAINLKHELLPDAVVFTALWAGLLVQTSSGNAEAAIHGAAVGYLAPFLVSFAFRLSTGGDVIGQGDLKALAMAGAWFGLSALPLIFGAFMVGSIAWLVAAKVFSVHLRGAVPTGPAHLFASIAAASGVSVF